MELYSAIIIMLGAGMLGVGMLSKYAIGSPDDVLLALLFISQFLLLGTLVYRAVSHMQKAKKMKSFHADMFEAESNFNEDELEAEYVEVPVMNGKMRDKSFVEDIKEASVPVKASRNELKQIKTMQGRMIVYLLKYVKKVKTENRHLKQEKNEFMKEMEGFRALWALETQKKISRMAPTSKGKKKSPTSPRRRDAERTL